MPTIFRSSTGAPRKVRTLKPERTTPASRGYDKKWRTRSERYRRANPFCAKCQEDPEAPLLFAAVVHHKFPVQDGGAVHCDDRGLMGLCGSHHALVTLWEEYARRTGQLDKLVTWCDQPETRPRVRRGDTR